MRNLRNIECKHDNYIKIRNMYVCVKCNRKFNVEQLKNKGIKNKGR